jgi:hypothetical protein
MATSGASAAATTNEEELLRVRLVNLRVSLRTARVELDTASYIAERLHQYLTDRSTSKPADDTATKSEKSTDASAISPPTRVPMG